MPSKKPVYEVTNINRIPVTVDLSLLSVSEDIYFNATEIAKAHNKKVDDFLRLNSTQEYIEAIRQERGFNVGNSRLKNYQDLVIIKKGKYGGTWLHKEIAFEFAGWCSALFRRKLHKFVEEKLFEEGTRKRLHLECKTGFLPLTNAIQNAHAEIKPHHFSNECNLINRIVLGMSAKEYQLKHGVKEIRAHLLDWQLKAINHLQMVDAGLIEIGMKYEERKSRLTELFERQFKAKQIACNGGS